MAFRYSTQEASHGELTYQFSPECSNVNDQLRGGTNAAMPTTGNKRQNGIVETLIQRIRLHHKRRTDLTPRGVAIREVD
jgi:hypothetical protein